MNRRAFVQLAGFGSAVSAACGGTPTAPSVLMPLPIIVPTLPLLLAGQSNAVLLRDLAMPSVVNVVQGGTGIEAWLPDQPLGRELVEKARAREYAAFLWWHGESAVALSRAEYAVMARLIVSGVRAQQPTLPVRIIDILPLPQLDEARAALRWLAADPFSQLIETRDLRADDDGGGHFVPSAYPIVRDRIYRSLAAALAVAA